MFGILGLGFLLGMQHALEADHIAAVSSIAARRSQVGDIVRHGLTWGLGHTLTLFIFAGAALLLGHAIPESLARPIETAVGIMLVGLMHGMAGSAALLVLTVSQAPSPAVGLGYVALFGIGSMIGMGALSTLIAVPLAVTARWLTFANHGLQAAVGAVTIAIGVRTIVEMALA